jgi:hypothetical protein
MAKAITSIGTYSNTEAAIRQRLSRMMGDCILATLSAGSTTTATLASTNPPQFYEKPDDFFNEQWYEFYTYAGTNIGYTNVAKDWVKTTHVLTGAITMASAYASTSKLELHNIFYVSELRDAINQAINFYTDKYLLDLDDSTTITLTRTERNDVSGSYIPTYEYALPTTCLWLNRVTTESRVSGVKLTGTISDTFTLGEKVTGDTSGATGLLSYSGATYIRLREVNGTFVTGETATGVSTETCSAITAVDYEPAGTGVFPEGNVVDSRDWRVLKPYAPELKFDENYYSVIEDLRIKTEFQGIQDEVTADTDTIMLPPDELVEVAATFLPFSKIESNNLVAKFNRCLETRAKVEARPKMHPYANARKCW